MGGDPRDPQRGAPGKLKAAARHWADQRQGGRDELAEDLELLGLADQIKPGGDQSFCVWPENTTTVSAFVALDGHWQLGRSADGMQQLRMPPEKIKDTLELMGVKRRQWPEVFNDLLVMETEVLDTLFGETE